MMEIVRKWSEKYLVFLCFNVYFMVVQNMVLEPPVVTHCQQIDHSRLVSKVGCI